MTSFYQLAQKRKERLSAAIKIRKNNINTRDYCNITVVTDWLTNVAVFLSKQIALAKLEDSVK
ncbi:hypothetical protein ACU8KH_03400 [Lachancea thermotolerans]